MSKVNIEISIWARILVTVVNPMPAQLAQIFTRKTQLLCNGVVFVEPLLRIHYHSKEYIEYV